jgi:hypothetical protein
MLSRLLLNWDVKIVNMKPFIISYVIYPFELMICCEKKYKKLKKILKTKLPKDVHGEIDECFNVSYNKGRAVMFSSGQTCINFKYKPTHEMIAHEIFHAVYFFFNRIDMPLCKKSDEAYAYLIGYITEQVYVKMEENN